MERTNILQIPILRRGPGIEEVPGVRYAPPLEVRPTLHERRIFHKQPEQLPHTIRASILGRKYDEGVRGGRPRKTEEQKEKDKKTKLMLEKLASERGLDKKELKYIKKDENGYKVVIGNLSRAKAIKVIDCYISNKKCPNRSAKSKK